jgi:ribokinase
VQDQSARIVVIGSINMDLVARCSSIPKPGETVLGDELRQIPGGKGANQAVAAARLGAEVYMVGAVGGDVFGRRALEELRAAGVNTDQVRTIDSASTGVALIAVNSAGENAITVAPGANRCVNTEDVERALPLLRAADVCLLQLEIPVEADFRAIRICRELGVTTVLDAAPALPDPPDDLFRTEVLTANLAEAETLTGISGDGSESHARSMIAALSERGLKRVVLKLGDRGSLAYDDPDYSMMEADRVEVVDATAAGDAFNAALGVYLARRHSLFSAQRRANAAGALACTKLGAMPAMPTAEQVDRRLQTA